jgi:hypothetical protein
VGAISVFNPNGGEKIGSGSTFPVLINAPLGIDHFRLEVSLNGGQTWQTVANNVPSGGVTTLYQWNVPIVSKRKSNVLFRAQGFSAGGVFIGSDTSDDPFSVVVVQMGSPAGGELLIADDLHKIEWTTFKTESKVQRIILYISTNGGDTWLKVAGRHKNRGTFNWIVPTFKGPKVNCILRIDLMDGQERVIGSDETDLPFAILPEPIN